MSQTENNVIKIIIAIVFLIFAYFIIQIFSGQYSKKLANELSGPKQAMIASYQAQIAAETDAYQATRLGDNFDKAQEKDLALTAYTKATELDPNYRDGWLLKGYEELKLDKSNEALASLKKAEEIDPINPRTYELLAVAYRANDDEEAAKKAEEKADYLKKTK